MTRPQDHFKPHLFRASHSGSSGSRQCLRAWLKRRSGFGKALRRSWRAQEWNGRLKSPDQWRLWIFFRDDLDSTDSTDSIFINFHQFSISQGDKKGLKIILKGHISRMTWWLLVVMTAVIQIWSVASWTCYINPLDGFVLEWFTGHSPNKNQQLI